MSDTPNPVDTAKTAAAESIAELKRSAETSLSGKRAELQAAEIALQAAADKRNSLSAEIRALEKTVDSYNKLTARIAGAKIADPRAAETCVF